MSVSKGFLLSFLLLGAVFPVAFAPVVSPEREEIINLSEEKANVFCVENYDCRLGICYFYPQICGLNTLCETRLEFPNFVCHDLNEVLEAAVCAEHGCGAGTQCHRGRSATILCTCRNMVVPIGQPCEQDIICSQMCDVTAKCTSDGNNEFCICPNDGRIVEKETPCFTFSATDEAESDSKKDDFEDSKKDVNKNDGAGETLLSNLSNTASRSGTADALLPKKRFVLYAWIAVSLIVLSMAFCSCILVSMHRSKLRKRRSILQGVLWYVRNLNVADLNIRRSPAGGYNVSFLEGVADSKNNDNDEIDEINETDAWDGDDGYEEKSLSNKEDEDPRLQPRRQKMVDDELSSLMALAVPVVFTYLMEHFPSIVSLILVGQHDTPETKIYLDATALAFLFTHLTGLTIGTGLLTALDTFGSQAYGAQQPHKIGIFLQAGVLVLSVVFLFTGIISFYASSILVAFGQPLEVSELAGDAVLILFPGVFFLLLYELLRKVLQSQNHATPMFLVSILANVINFTCGYYLVYHTDYGWLGACWARTIANISFFVLLSAYLLYSDLLPTFWTGIDLSKAAQDIPLFLSLGIPGMMQHCFEWWAFEIIFLFCGRLPNAVDAIGANAVTLNIFTFIYSPYWGYNVSGSVRVGNALGAGDHELAKVAANLTIGLSFLSGIICSALLLIFKEQLPGLFTQEQDIAALATKVIVVLALLLIPDSINCANQGIFRGSGRLTLGAALNFVAYYLLGLPLGCMLAFSDQLFGDGWGVVGFWWGMFVGIIITGSFGTYIVQKSDWEALSKDAEERIEAALKPVSPQNSRIFDISAEQN